MKKKLISFLFLLCFGAQQIQARAVLSGESLWAMQRLVTQASCDVTIRQIDLTAGVFTISTSGVYCLAENIAGKIVIDTNNVILDLNSKTITNSSDNCVEVNGRSQAFIKNGSVIAANNSGISVLSGSARVMVEHVTTRNCTTGIEVDSSNNVYIDGCDLIASDTGMLFNNVSRAEVHDTNASDSVYVGFELDGSSKSFFANCHALNTGQGLADLTADIYGFLSTDGSSNIFRSCIVQNTLALTVTGEPNVAVGFAFTGTESNSQITKCTSSIIETDANGFTIPYGIQLQYSFDALTLVTGGDQGSAASSVDWSPDGVFLAVAGAPESGAEIQIFSFDRVTETVTTLTVENQGTVLGRVVAWSPSGDYLATGGGPENGDEIQVFSFDRVAGRLTKTDGKNQGTNCFAVSWSPNEAYLATGGATEAAAEIQIFPFDRAAGTLGTRTDGQSQGTNCFSVSWSPNGAYLATGGETEGADDEIQVFSFNRSTGILTKTDGQSQGANCFSVSWSPNGAYLATGGATGGADDEIQVFSFNRAAGTLTRTDGQSQGTQGNAVAWSPDGAYLATGGNTGGVDDEIQIFSFDRSTGTVSKIDGQPQGGGCEAVAWTPDGVYLATGGIAEGSFEFQIFKAFLFPLRNVITNNSVQSASRASSLADGVGISGSSIENLIIGNSSYNNGGFNYQLVSNVFDERFTTIPTAVQNLSIKLPPLFYSP